MRLGAEARAHVRCAAAGLDVRTTTHWAAHSKQRGEGWSRSSYVVALMASGGAERGRSPHTDRHQFKNTRRITGSPCVCRRDPAGFIPSSLKSCKVICWCPRPPLRCVSRSSSHIYVGLRKTSVSQDNRSGFPKALTTEHLSVLQVSELCIV